MILVDYRQGSQELIEPLRSLGLPVDETTLAYGDIAFEGRGVKGKSVSIGIEFKKFNELVSSLRTGRLVGHQLPGMRDAYDYSWLLIEGEMHHDKTGALLVRSGRHSWRKLPMSVSEFLKRLTVMQVCGGLTPIWAAGRRTTLRQIEMLYRVWTDADLDAHKSHIAVYEPPPIRPVSQFRRTVMTLPDVGMQVSAAAEKRFKGSIRDAINAPVDAWANLSIPDKTGKTRRLGMKAATRIVETVA